MKSFLHNDDIEIYSTHNEGKVAVAERFIKTLKNKIYSYMTSVSIYIDQIDDIVNEYNNAYNSTIKMNPVDIKSNTYIDSNKENNKEGLKFKVGDHAKISKCKNIFEKRLCSRLV